MYSLSGFGIFFWRGIAMSFILCPIPSVNYGTLPNIEIQRLWEQVGNNISSQRLTELHSGKKTESASELAYMLVWMEMSKRNLLSVARAG